MMLVSQRSVGKVSRCLDVAKLMELNSKFELVEPGQKVLDIGAAPGSWSQFLADKTNSHARDSSLPVGSVIAVDIEPFESIEGVVTLPNMNFLAQDSQNKIIKALGKGQKFDVILSDMDPILIGPKTFDSERYLKVFIAVLMFVVTNLKEGGHCLIKVLDDQNGYIKSYARQLFRAVNFPKVVDPTLILPNTYLLAKDFKGLKGLKRT